MRTLGTAFLFARPRRVVVGAVTRNTQASAPDRAVFALGSRLGSYRLGRRMAADATGQLFEAHDTRLNRQVAVRLLVANATSDIDRLTRFAQEAKTTALLNHPNIAAVYDVGSFDGVPFVVSELLQGETV